MKTSSSILFITVFLFSSTAFAIGGPCIKLLKRATAKAAADPECRTKANDLFVSCKEQIQICEDFRNFKKECRHAKSKAKSTCKNEKRDQKKECKKKKGKSKRKCKQKMRQDKRECKKDARQEKRACKNDAKNTKEFEVCKDSRKVTRRAAGDAAKCAGKYYSVPVAVCIAELVTGI